MNWDRLETLHESYGANPDRWPARERAAALTLMETDRARAEMLRARHADLDAILDGWPAPALSDEGLAVMDQRAKPGRIVQIHAWMNRLTGWRGPPWQPASAFASAVILGLLIGGFSTNATDLFAPDLFVVSAEIAAPTEAEAPDNLETLILEMDSLIGEGDFS